MKDLFTDFRTRFIDFNEKKHVFDDVFGAFCTGRDGALKAFHEA